MEEKGTVVVAVPVATGPVAVLVAHSEYDTCVADRTSTIKTPIPLSCCSIPEFGFALSAGAFVP